MDLEKTLARAGDFIALHGEVLDRIFFETLARERDATELLEELVRRQEPAGAIAPWRRRGEAGETSTAVALRRLDALGLLDHPLPEAAVGYLQARQAADGGWGTGDDALRLQQTGEIGGLLAKTPFGRPSVLLSAERFLAKHWSVVQVRAGGAAAIEAFVHMLAHAPSELADEAMQWCGRELERGYRAKAFSALATARVFLCARARALPGCQVDAAELVAALANEQEDDGGWSGAGRDARLDATLDAVEVLLRLG